MPSAEISIPQIAREVSENTGVTIERAEFVLKSAVNVITYHLRERGERVYLNGLGTFRMYEAPVRRHHDVRDGQVRTVGARRHAKFSASASLRGLPIIRRPEPAASLADECPV